jgi:hypothetical protein
MEVMMKQQPQTHRTVDLAADQVLTLDGPAGAHVRVLHGAAWLTQEGQLDDVVLRGGATQQLREGRAVFAALEPTRLQLAAAAARPRPWTVAAWRSLRRHVTRLQFGVAAGVPAL